jgi:hypothetical protein
VSIGEQIDHGCDDTGGLRGQVAGGS